MAMLDKPIRVSELDPSFKAEVIAHEAAGDITACFSCRTCTAGCPIHEIFPEYDPRKMARMVNLGMRERVLSSPCIWYCATCHTCEQRCPQNVKFFSVLNVLKNMAAKEEYAPPSWVNQTKQVMQTGIVFPTEEAWVKRREEFSLRPLKGDGKEAKRDLSRLQVAPHYGCHYLKPGCMSEGFDEPDNPKTLHELIGAASTIPIEYETLDYCCGGKAFPNSQDLTHSLIAKKLENLRDREIDCMVLQCQTCYLMYAAQQKKVSEKFGKQYNIPVLLYPQLLGLAMGADAVTDLGLNLNTPPVDKLLTKVENGYRIGN